jgi:ABC-type sugar transport system ATPase subunit
MVAKPRAILFDEPLSNLDARLRERMRLELLALRQQAPFTSVYVTHDQLEAITLADRVVVMRAGKIEQVGSPETSTGGHGLASAQTSSASPTCSKARSVRRAEQTSWSKPSSVRWRRAAGARTGPWSEMLRGGEAQLAGDARNDSIRRTPRPRDQEHLSGHEHDRHG